jgi:hypothetical protein
MWSLAALKTGTLLGMRRGSSKYFIIHNGSLVTGHKVIALSWKPKGPKLAHIIIYTNEEYNF